MTKKAAIRLLTAALCLLMIPCAAPAETRAGAIALEGMEEAIEETLYESPEGFSFWYVNDRFTAAPGETGVVVASPLSDDYLALSLISEEEALKYAKEHSAALEEQPDAPRIQTELYQELKNRRFRFSALIGENGRYLLASGVYALEAAEGTAKYFQRVIDSVSILSEYDAQMLRVLPGQWAETYEGREAALTLGEKGELSLACIAADGSVSSWEGDWRYDPVPDSMGLLTLRFTSADNAQSGKWVFAAYTESWVESDTLITYLLLNPAESGEGVSPFEAVFGSGGADLRREQGPNMRVAHCKEFVSLRQERSASSKRLAKVPLGARVLAFPEAGNKNGFLLCVYQDAEGYILAEYLEPAE